MPRQKAKKTDDHPIGRLFDVVTLRLEQAHEVSVQGQSPALSMAQQRVVHRRLLQSLERCKQAADRLGNAIERASR